MDVVTIALAVLAVAFAGLAVFFWSSRRTLLAHLAAVEEEVAALRAQSDTFHGAFELYRRSHLSLIDAVRPRVLDNEQKIGLRMHLRELAGIRVKIRVAADTEPATYAQELCKALNVAGARAELDPSRDVEIGQKDLEGVVEVAPTARARLLRAALKAFAHPLAERELTQVRVRRGGAESEEPEIVITLGSRRIPPELMDLPPPPKPPRVKQAPKIRAVTPVGGDPTSGIE